MYRRVARSQRGVWPVLAAASLCALGSGWASAADLGGNCCADLEERIAELEATTARKGNRKVSLTVSGWVNEAVFFWDDGTERNAYIGTNELEQTRFRFNGEAKIKDGWSAGYILEIGANGAGSRSFSQDTDDGAATVNTVFGVAAAGNVTVRKSAWFVKSKELGKVTVGRYDTATYHLIDNVDTLLTRNVSDFEAAGVALGAFKIRVNGAFQGPAATPTTWINIMGGFNNGAPGQSGLRNTARYDTPEIAGFTGSASWGEDDQWEVSLKYKREDKDWVINAAVG